jgi:hypothetical protein
MAVLNIQTEARESKCSQNALHFVVFRFRLLQRGILRRRFVAIILVALQQHSRFLSDSDK